MGESLGFVVGLIVGAKAMCVCFALGVAWARMRRAPSQGLAA